VECGEFYGSFENHPTGELSLPCAIIRAGTAVYRSLWHTASNECSEMSIIEIHGTVGRKIKVSIGIYLRGIVLNAGQPIAKSGGLDIRIAEKGGYIIADASGA